MPLISKLPSCMEKLIKKIFVTPPKYTETNFWLLKKCVYGLVDTLRKWYHRVKPLLLSVRLNMSKGDPSIFYCYSDNIPQALIAISVDVFLWSRTNDFETYYISKFHKNFAISEENHCVF